MTNLESARKYRLKYPERCREATQRWRDKYPEKVKEQNRKQKLANRGVISHRKWRYGVTKEQFDNMVNNQSGKCAICSIELLTKPHLDHDHKNGKNRGVLCFHCNAGLGQFKDNAEFLLKAIEYLKCWGMR